MGPVKSRLHLRKGEHRPPRKGDNPSTSKPNSSLNEVDQHIINQPPRVRNAGATASNPVSAATSIAAASAAASAAAIPSTRGIDPPESDDAPQVTLTRGN